jgi:hypothetical protein
MASDNKVVVRYRNGDLLKGYTHDFSPEKEFFHVIERVTGERTKVIDTGQLKAIFFVKSFEGDRRRMPSPDWDWLKKAPGVKVKVTFDDGEIIFGASSVYHKLQRGFFVRPADHGCNIERMYVLSKATDAVDTWL